MSNSVPGSAAVEKLRARMDKLGIKESDIEESFILGGGPGGQKVNKTCSCVRLVHKLTGTEVRCGDSRSLALNRHAARSRLCDRIEERMEGAASRRAQEIEKIRRQKRRRSRRQKQRMLDDKSHRGEIKKGRRPVDAGE